MASDRGQAHSMLNYNPTQNFSQQMSPKLRHSQACQRIKSNTHQGWNLFKRICGFLLLIVTENMLLTMQMFSIYKYNVKTKLNIIPGHFVAPAAFGLCSFVKRYKHLYLERMNSTGISGNEVHRAKTVEVSCPSNKVFSYSLTL